MTAYLYLTKTTCQTANQSFELETEQGLPSIARLFQALDTAATGDRKMAVLLQDDLLHPLRIELEQKPGRRELTQFLGWKAKKFLPWPIDDVALRYLPLAESNTWLTFALLQSWTTTLFDGFKARDIHCGYIGGLCMTLLENTPALRNHETLAFFDDFYLHCRLDQKGHYQHFGIRRLPFDAAGRLDTETLIGSDLQAMDGSLKILNFAPALDHQILPIRQALGQNGPANTGGNTLERFLDVMQGRGGAA